MRPPISFGVFCLDVESRQLFCGPERIVKEPVRLEDGDRIRLDGVEMVFRMATASGSTETLGLMRLPEGTRLGPYEIARFLGAGRMGEVYKARDTRLGRLVAVKILAPDAASDPTRRKRFEREVTGPGGVVGTLQYMPPEQFNGRPDARSDLFALGAIIR
jgi:serine/threonine protein kinase